VFGEDRNIIMLFNSIAFVSFFPQLMADSSFIFADYFDADHLSEMGVKKLSMLINGYISDRNN
jgi:hypothetical protein